MTWQTFVLRLVELLRPRFYNRITWLVVIGGLAMMSTQFWELVATELLNREFNISISGSNDAAWGFALCVLGLVYHMANTGFYDLLKGNEIRARREQEREHDKEVFREARLILSDEHIESFVETLQCDHSYYMNESSRIASFARYLATTSNRFLTPSISGATERLLVAWSAVDHFISYKFFIFPNNQIEPPFRLCMTPDLNMDRDGNGAPAQVEKYDKLSNELEELTENLVTEYRTFRTAVKNEFVI